MIRLCFFLSLFSVPFFGLYNLNPNPRQLERNFQRKKNKKKTTKIAKQSKKEICVINEKNVSVNNLRFIRRVKMARVFSFYSLLFFSSFHRIVSMRKKSTEGEKKRRLTFCLTEMSVIRSRTENSATNYTAHTASDLIGYKPSFQLLDGPSPGA